MDRCKKKEIKTKTFEKPVTIHGYENRLKLGTLTKLVVITLEMSCTTFHISSFLLLDVSSPRIALGSPLVDFRPPRTAVWIGRTHADVFYICYHFLKLLDSETHSLLQAKVVLILFFLDNLMLISVRSLFL